MPDLELAGSVTGPIRARGDREALSTTAVLETDLVHPAVAGDPPHALHRMERRGWIESEWGVSESNRRAKYYRLSPSGRKQLKAEIARWNRLVYAISNVLNPVAAEG